MKFRVEVAVEDDAGKTTNRVVVMEKLCDFEKAISIGLGMTLADGKDESGRNRGKLFFQAAIE